MKPFQTVFFVAALCLLGACEPNPTSSPALTQLGETGGLQELEGTWIGHDKGGFTLVKIKADSTGTYTTFTDREKEIGASFPADRYFFYESAIKVTYEPTKYHQPKVSVHTNKFRFDYYLSGDTLIEYDKMGLQGTLVRMKLKQQ
ncbi:hypothetical protein [Hymenobacter glacieicola]|uniref:DUF306 domain-containing protein n=1 Tax=Hymenobacter glacieicola TaxID=1562124 RepID=A0ABQ1WWI5_9BACT|nr:hypothetical protein [Hymenobacter glacieicola]GGG47594.1 hypothetical protein GCM10011378_24720 [Hymenobacter glacieicola]